MEQSENILMKRASVEAKRALELISDALLISPFSEKLLEMKAEALFMVSDTTMLLSLQFLWNLINFSCPLIIVDQLAVKFKSVQKLLIVIDAIDNIMSFFVTLGSSGSMMK